MDVYDPAKAARVWQRVQGGSGLPDADLLEWIREEWKDAVIYLHLSRIYQGRDQRFLRCMYEQEQAHFSCLKGIYSLQTGKSPDLLPPQPPKGNVETILRACYGREMRCLARYEARVNDPEYGPVFTRLAAAEKEHCRQVLELLGKLPRQ